MWSSSRPRCASRWRTEECLQSVSTKSSLLPQTGDLRIAIIFEKTFQNFYPGHRSPPHTKGSATRQHLWLSQTHSEWENAPWWRWPSERRKPGWRPPWRRRATSRWTKATFLSTCQQLKWRKMRIWTRRVICFSFKDWVNYNANVLMSIYIHKLVVQVKTGFYFRIFKFT